MTSFRLRPVVTADLDVFFIHQQDETARHQAAFVSEDPSDRAAFDRHWTKVLGRSSWVPRTVEVDGDPVGHIILFDVEGVPEITYWLDRARWGEGIATRAVALLLAEVARRPVYARVAADNIGSRRVLEKSGFAEVAREQGFAKGRGEVIDELVMRLSD